jgi:hypothetical protein
LIKTPFGGRYCGKIPPRPRISLYKILSFVFLTDRDNITLSRFNGSFSFIPDTSYKLGAVDTSHGRDSVCNFLIDSSSPSSNMYGGGGFGGRRGSKEGRIMTPTYPGTYPKKFEMLV